MLASLSASRVLSQDNPSAIQQTSNEIAQLRQRAQNGDTTAEVSLARQYVEGSRVPLNYKEAAKWFRAAGEQGLPAAQNNLAYMYYTGTGVPLDYSEAANWTRRAAERGYALAQTDLGYLFEQGKEVPLDYTAAYMWYSIGAQGGDSRSPERMKSLASLMGSKQLIEAKGRADAWMPQRKSSMSGENEKANYLAPSH